MTQATISLLNMTRVSNAASDAVLTAAKAALDDALKQMGYVHMGRRLSVYTFDKTEAGQGGVNAICLAMTDEKTATVAVSVGVLAASLSENYTTVQKTYQGKQYDEPVFAADALDQDLDRLVTRSLSQQISPINGASPTVMVLPNPYVIANCFDFSDARAVGRLIGGIVSQLSIVFQPQMTLNLAAVNSSEMLSITVDPRAPTYTQPDGTPVRSDLSVTCVAQNRQRQRPSTTGLNAAPTSALLTTSRGYIDLVFAPEETQVNQRPIPPWLARAIVTSLESHVNAGLPGLILALANFFSVRDNDCWIGSLANRSGNKLREPGAMAIANYLLNNDPDWNMPVTRQASQDDLHKFFKEYLKPELQYGIRLSRSQFDSMYMRTLALAATGDQRAKNEIFDACETLSGNNFSRYYNGGDIFVQSDAPEYCLIGTMTDADGHLLDIAELDWTALQQSSPNETDIYRIWHETLVNSGDQPVALKMGARLRQIQYHTGATTSVYDYGRIEMFCGDFITALMRSLAETGMMRNVNAANPFADYTSIRSAPNWLASARTGNNVNRWNNSRTPSGNGAVKW